jgi:hypothetical protein
MPFDEFLFKKVPKSSVTLSVSRQVRWKTRKHFFSFSSSFFFLKIK